MTDDKKKEEQVQARFEKTVELAEERAVEMAEAKRILPAWFIPRMIDDSWHFGLLTTSGHIIEIECIYRVLQDANGGIWIDVALVEMNGHFFGDDKTSQSLGKRFAAPTGRHTASINVAHIVAAFELADG